MTVLRQFFCIRGKFAPNISTYPAFSAGYVKLSKARKTLASQNRAKDKIYDVNREYLRNAS